MQQKKKAPLCNKELEKDVIRETGESQRLIRSITSYVSEYIADVMKEGAFESVLVPYFGKFQAKTKEVQWKAQRQGEERL